MVKVETKAGNAYCIDSTEVTNADYKAFIDSKPSLANQPPECSFNMNYLPEPSPPMPWPVMGLEAYPVHFIDWCDARAYCAFAGKRLCGLVGGGSNPTNSLDPDTNEWMNACTHQGTKAFAYDNNFQNGACNVGSSDLHTDKSAPVASFPQCQGGFDGLYDMLGNVSEFVDDCSDGVCPSMGSPYFQDVGPCGVWLSLSISEGGALGIRCCRDSD